MLTKTHTTSITLVAAFAALALSASALAENDIKIGNRSQFSQRGSSAAVPTVAQARPQRVAFRPERVFSAARLSPQQQQALLG
jgi:hypothetical protein